MLKTPLPDYSGWVTHPNNTVEEDHNQTINHLIIQYNQLITYLAELSEVVEGKSDYKEGYKQGRFDAEMDGANLEFKQVTPTLKEAIKKELK